MRRKISTNHREFKSVHRLNEIASEHERQATLAYDAGDRKSAAIWYSEADIYRSRMNDLIMKEGKVK